MIAVEYPSSSFSLPRESDDHAVQVPDNTMPQSIISSPLSQLEVTGSDSHHEVQADWFNKTFGPFYYKGPRDAEEKKLVEQAEALGKEFDFDPSVLTPEQSQALFRKYWAIHCETFELRSPQHYEGISQCLSISETVWPGAVAMLKAQKMKQGYIEPEDLIARLRMLKPSDNFRLRKFRHPPMSWKSPTPLKEEGYEISPSDPDWFCNQLYDAPKMERRLGTSWVRQHRCEVKNRWAAVKSSVELTPSPDLHLLRDMGRSPGGTLFPWYLVKGLMTLRNHANDQGTRLYDGEQDNALVKREEAICQWKERNPESTLSYDLPSIYKTWPTDLMDVLDELERDAIRCGRRKYVALLKETEKSMQAFVAFWRDCGLITGKRTPPSCWWQDPKAKVERLPKPEYLTNELDAIINKFGYQHDEGNRSRMIATSRWLESMMNGDTEHVGADTPLPPSLLDELNIVWRDRFEYDNDDTEDEMISRLRRWRESKYQQRSEEEEGLRTSPQLGSAIGPEPSPGVMSPVLSGQENSLPDGPSDLVMASEEMRQLRGNLPKVARPRLGRKSAMPKDQATWKGRLRPRTTIEDQKNRRERLRPRYGAVSTLCEKNKETGTRSGKPHGIVKHRKSSKRMRPVAAMGQSTTSIAQNADLEYQSNAQVHSDDSSPRVTRAERTKSARRQTRQQASAAQPHGVQKARKSKRSQSHGLMGAALTTTQKQELLPLLTPPQSLKDHKPN